MAKISKMLASFLPWKRVTVVFVKLEWLYKGKVFEILFAMHERCILKLKIYTKIKRSEKNEKILSPFNATVPFLYPLKVTENHRFSDIFMGYENGKLALIGLNEFQAILTSTVILYTLLRTSNTVLFPRFS